MPDLTRRTLLRFGAGVATGAAAYALGTLLNAEPSRAAGPGLMTPPPREPAPPAGAVPTYLTGSFVSAARGGVQTNWIIARPAGQTGTLRPVIALHGRGGNAGGVMDLGVQDGLAEVVKAGGAPFAVVAVDGGDNSYWHRRASGEDAGAMVLSELLPMLETKGLDTSRVAFMGWSMGGYGALLLGARLGPGRTAGICAVSPALWSSYWLADQGAFDGPEDWASNSVFGQPALSSIPIRVDCGTSDRFYAATRQFVDQLRRPVAGSFSPGGHDVSFWRRQLPDELKWMAS
ncbi:alpha/beta hydrolase [Mycobacterium sp.]|uniref:alpha/beta hydrolase n=1 Tax=Mycobacterium sp. TaxID=1785 RepID=UPI002D14BF86|nr:alpha/beta hydrolase-fold protein [Mycobacterium sp.]HME48838.1 alpha/beta hydrolase-fold protein [Mycobacterium sp.]